MIALQLPRLFIGSSIEGLKVARAIQENLEYDAETTIWNQGIFTATKQTLIDLLAQTRKTDFAVFAFTADDQVNIRGNNYSAVRDNLVFELGMFIGHLGLEKCFFVIPRGLANLHLPTDLIGAMPLDFESNRSDVNLTAALGSACHHIRKKILSANSKSSTTDHVTTQNETTTARMRRLIELWNTSSMLADRDIVNQMPMWIGEDNDGKATEAFQRIIIFFNAVAQTVLDDVSLDGIAKVHFSSALLSVQKHSVMYFVNWPNGEEPDEDLSPLGLLSHRWKIK